MPKDRKARTSTETSTAARLLEDGIERCLHFAAEQANRLDEEVKRAAKQKRLEKEGYVPCPKTKSVTTNATTPASSTEGNVNSEKSIRKMSKVKSKHKDTSISSSQETSNMAEWYYGVAPSTIQYYGIRIKESGSVVFNSRPAGDLHGLPVDVPQPRHTNSTTKKWNRVKDPLASNTNIPPAVEQKETTTSCTNVTTDDLASVRCGDISSLPTSETSLCLSDRSQDVSVLDAERLEPKESEMSLLSVAIREDNFLGRHDFPVYMVEGNIRRVYMTKMTVFRKRSSDWLEVHMEMEDTNGDPLLNVRSELLGYKTRNVVINGEEKKL